MNDYFKRIITLLSLLLAVLLVCVGMTQFGRRLAAGTFKPFLVLWERMVHAASRTTGRVFATEKEREGMNREKRLAELLVAVQATEKLQEENRQLRKMMDLPVPDAWRAVYAQVILRDPLTWNTSFLVSRGSKDGVRLGSPVLFQDELIGRVTEIYQETAKVSTLASSECKFSVFVLGEHWEEYPGIFQGDGEANGNGIITCTIEYLPKLADFKEGARVVTSGMGRDVPHGIFVGFITPTEDGAASSLVDNARRCAKVRPAADFRKLYYVTILVNNNLDPEPEKENENE